MKKTGFALLICAALLLTLGPAALAAGGESGFYGIDAPAGIGISPVTADGAAVAGVRMDADGDGEDDVFYPGSRALVIMIEETMQDQMYLLTVSSEEGVLYADQKDGGGRLSFTAAFALPEGSAALTVEIGSTEPGFRKVTAPLRYTSFPHGLSYAVCAKDDACPLSAFTDADPAAWYHDGVHFVLENGIMNGVSEDTFSPLRPASRGMIVTMLWRLEGMPETEYAAFSDVPAGSWCAKAVGWAAAGHIVDGYASGQFKPNDPVSREQLAVILWRYAKYRGTDQTGAREVNLGVYVDTEHISQWAYEGMQWAVNAGLISGTENDRLSPKAAAGRAQVATILMRFSFLG